MTQQKKRGLGKGLSDLGLSELLGDLQAQPAIVMSDFSTVGEGSQDGRLKKLPINSIQPGPHQPRKSMSQEGLEELANSIRKQGIIQPIVVRPTQHGQYEIIAGERRFRAAKLAELETIPALIREITDEAAMAIALIENIQRRDLNAIEEAAALERLMTEFNMTHQAVADAVGKSRVNVTNLLRLLKLNSDVQLLVERGHLEMGHARALLTLENEQQSQIANLVVTRALSVRETEALIRKVSFSNSFSPSLETKAALPDLDQERLSSFLRTTVFISKNAKNKGKLIIKFRNQSELDFILSKIQ